ncbi:hypothetical protein PHMEG_0004758 [Phytophthora megakarya]|uniref:Uncharacterized protein n=1 Tax=Phytophthora megakarya TaxID=4795 RepID=A0A225WT18_9STRA|nr:hypothetical protein PHMEG_0004758 [Phytophthora megakarya]
MSASPNPRKQRRAILQEAKPDSRSSSEVGDAVVEDLSVSLTCVFERDANMMNHCADKCTYLNSDEGLDMWEDHEDDDEDDYSDDDYWVEDWSIGELSGEESSDDGRVELAESVCYTLAQSKKALATMMKID